MSVYQRNGHWHLRVTINGKRYRKAIKEARTQTQAERAERILRDEIFEKRFGDGGFTRFGDFVEKSYKPYAKEHKRGYNVELSILNVLIEKFGKQRLVEITPEAVENFKQDRKSETTKRNKPRSKSTVNRDVAVLSAVFKLAVRYKEVRENPVKNVRYYGQLNSRERVLSKDEEIILFNKIKDDIIFSSQIEILLYTGMRRGELFKLEWRDINFDDNLIVLRKETTKTGKGRQLPMLSNVRKIFDSLNSETTEKSKFDKIFPGKIWKPTSFSTKFRKVCNNLGWQDMTIHSLRHTYSTRIYQLGISPFTQKFLLGHSKLSMTDKYTHPSKETIKENLVSFEEFVSSMKK